jgi:hypothetical protein
MLCHQLQAALRLRIGDFRELLFLGLGRFRRLLFTPASTDGKHAAKVFFGCFDASIKVQKQ